MIALIVWINNFWAETPILFFGFPHRMEPRLLEILGRTSVCEIGKVGLIHSILVNSYSLGCVFLPFMHLMMLSSLRFWHLMMLPLRKRAHETQSCVSSFCASHDALLSAASCPLFAYFIVLSSSLLLCALSHNSGLHAHVDCACSSRDPGLHLGY